MSDLDDLLDVNDPEVQAIMAEIKKHAEYHKDHPDQCPHSAIVAPVIDGLEEQPGFCLDCHAAPVMERTTDCPLCEDASHELPERPA